MFNVLFQCRKAGISDSIKVTSVRPKPFRSGGLLQVVFPLFRANYQFADGGSYMETFPYRRSDL